jgi:hypothetical protein
MYEQAEEILLPKFNSIEPDVKQQCVEAMIEFSNQQNKELLSIAKRCLYLFDNETSYPAGSIGYTLKVDCKKAIR